MTKKLSDQVKKDNQTKRKQQKAPSTTVVKVTQPKHEGPAESSAGPVNLCDDCAYEFGECDGKPKFGIDQDGTLTGPEADRVVECPAFVNVSEMPAADQVKKNAAAPDPAAAEEKPAEGRRECDVEHLRDYPECFEGCPKDECDGVPAAAHDGGDKGPAEAEEESEPEVKVIRTDLPQRPDPKRFQADEDFGTCQSCQRPLKRTALNRYHDAVRCTNPRCRAYRAIVKTISTGVK